MISVYTITCNRLELTKKYLFELRKKAGINYRHLIVDNGSTDGTLEWLQKYDFEILSLPINIGILDAMKIAINYINREHGSRYIAKFDNDCEIVTENILLKLYESLKVGCQSRILAPYDLNILPHQHPKIYKENDSQMFVQHTGGIFQFMNIDAANLLLNQPAKIAGGDLLRGRFWISKGYDNIYMKKLQIKHQGLGNQTENYKLA